MGRGRGARTRTLGGVCPRGASTRFSAFPVRSPLDVSPVREWAEALRSGEADDLVDTLLSPTGRSRPARQPMQLGGAMLGASQPEVRSGDTLIALGASYGVAMQWTLTTDHAGVRIALDAVLSRGEHRLGSFEASADRSWSAENDELLVASHALASLGRQLEAR